MREENSVHTTIIKRPLEWRAHNSTEFQCEDGSSVIRIEASGRMRLILRPEQKVIFLGHWQASIGTLLLSKSKLNIGKRSFTFAVPSEIWENLDSIQFIAVQAADRFFYATRAAMELFGETDQQINRNLRHGYRFLDVEHWREVSGLDELMGVLKSS